MRSASSSSSSSEPKRSMSSSSSSAAAAAAAPAAAPAPAATAATPAKGTLPDLSEGVSPAYEAMCLYQRAVWGWVTSPVGQRGWCWYALSLRDSKTATSAVEGSLLSCQCHVVGKNSGARIDQSVWKGVSRQSVRRGVLSRCARKHGPKQGSSGGGGEEEGRDRSWGESKGSFPCDSTLQSATHPSMYERVERCCSSSFASTILDVEGVMRVELETERGVG